MTDNQEILDEIKRAFNATHQGFKGTGLDKWTKAFKRDLITLGRKHNFKVYTSRADENETTDGGEWLFDLCWSNEDDSTKNGWKIGYKGLKLIYESEWLIKEDEIIYDFQKLAVAKAEIKIMLVQYNSTLRFDEIRELCKKSIDPSLFNDGAEYILVGSGNNENDKDIQWIKIS